MFHNKKTLGQDFLTLLTVGWADHIKQPFNFDCLSSKYSNLLFGTGKSFDLILPFVLTVNNIIHFQDQNIFYTPSVYSIDI